MLAQVCTRHSAKSLVKLPITAISVQARIIHSTPIVLQKQGLDYLSCKLRTYDNHLSPWYLLWKVGVPNRKIVSFRRSLKRFAYPWIEYCIPVALLMAVGDVMAQMVCVEEGKRPKEVDCWRTLKYALIGFFFLGPLLSKWNLYLFCRLKRRPAVMFILKKALLDTMVFAPPVLAGTIILYDHAYLEKADKSALEKVWCEKYAQVFIQILAINFLTRPIVALINCMMMPRSARRPIRVLYELALAIYVSKVFARSGYGIGFDDYTKQKVETDKKAKPPPAPHSSFCSCMQYLLGWFLNMDCCKDCHSAPNSPPGPAKGAKK